MSEESIKELQKAIKICGGVSALARLIGTSRQHIYNWISRDKKVSGEFCIPLEKATKGKTSRHKYRSDLYPKE